MNILEQNKEKASKRGREQSTIKIKKWNQHNRYKENHGINRWSNEGRYLGLLQLDI